MRSLFFSLHRIFGTLISLLFLMWFISGLVLIYHPFPNVSKEQKYEKMDTLPSSLPDIKDLLTRIPEVEGIRSVKVKQFQGQTLFSVKTKDSTYTLCPDSLEEVLPITQQNIDLTAKKWVNASVLKIDTLYDNEQWIMYSRYNDELPIYKYYFDDAAKHELYISSRTGEVQQFTSQSERMWAWFGAIPHKLYFPFLRQYTDIWINVLTISGIICLIASLTGIYIGISAYYKRFRHKKKIESPYKKRWYRWHHITGVIFGFFLATWAFSGAMSLQKIPQWAVKTNNDYKIASSKIRGKRLSIDKYALDYRTLKDSYPNLKEIEWSNFQSIPVYNIVYDNRTLTIDASSAKAKELYLTEEDILKSIRKIHGDSTTIRVSLINEYDEYYLSRERSLALPVYKIDVDDNDQSTYYINPKNGDYKYLDQNRKVKKWVFSGLHYFNIKFLVDRPLLWTGVIWILCIGGIIVCSTGVWLGIRFSSRKVKQVFRRKNC